MAVSKYTLSTCAQHTDCTLKAGFVSEEDPDYDPISSRRPVSARLQLHAENNFGPVYCVTLEHLEGRLSIEVPG